MLWISCRWRMEPTGAAWFRCSASRSSLAGYCCWSGADQLLPAQLETEAAEAAWFSYSTMLRLPEQFSSSAAGVARDSGCRSRVVQLQCNADAVGAVQIICSRRSSRRRLPKQLGSVAAVAVRDRGCRSSSDY